MMICDKVFAHSIFIVDDRKVLEIHRFLCKYYFRAQSNADSVLIKHVDLLLLIRANVQIYCWIQDLDSKSITPNIADIIMNGQFLLYFSYFLWKIKPLKKYAIELIYR